MRDALTVLSTVLVIFTLLSVYPPTRRALGQLAVDLRRDLQHLLRKLGLAPMPPPPPARRPAPGPPGPSRTPSGPPAPPRPPQRQGPQPKPC